MILEEENATPENVEIVLVNRDTICSFITQYHPPNVKSWERKNKQFRAVVDDVKSGAHLRCPQHKKIAAIEFASFGDPSGVCGNYQHGKCHSSSDTIKLVEQVNNETNTNHSLTCFYLINPFKCGVFAALFGQRKLFSANGCIRQLQK